MLHIVHTKFLDFFYLYRCRLLHQLLPTQMIPIQHMVCALNKYDVRCNSVTIQVSSSSCTIVNYKQIMMLEMNRQSNHFKTTIIQISC